MPLTDDAVLVPGVGRIFTKSTAGSTWTLTELNTFAGDGVTAPSGWIELGHTDLDSILVFNQDGGDSTVKGSWQNSTLREVNSPVVDSFTLNAEQVLDNDILSLYYGGGVASVAGRFALPDAPVATVRAVMLVMLDGVTPLGFSVAKASITRADAISAAADDFLKLPLKFTILKMASHPRAEWINTALGA